MLGFKKKKATDHSIKCQNVGGNCNGVCLCADAHVKSVNDALDDLIKQKKALVDKAQQLVRKTGTNLTPVKR